MVAEEGFVPEERVEEGAALVAEVPDSTTRPRWSMRRRALVLAGTLGLAACGTLVTVRGTAGSQAVHASPEDSTELMGTVAAMMTAIKAASATLHTADTASQLIQKSYGNITKMMKKYNTTYNQFGALGSKLASQIKSPLAFRKKMKAKLAGMSATEKKAMIAKFKKKYNLTTFDILEPTVDLYDGNACMHDEELFGDLCYAKCSTITAGKFPHRISAFSCCATKPPCKPSTTFGICKGNDVAGKSMGSVCPHARGGCLVNEELFDGTCYKKCNMLTFTLLPYRLGPSTCCKTNSRLAWMQLNDCESGDAYNRGGGRKIGNTSQWHDSHLPVKALTEK